ncbi:hypothetical protein HZ326_21751 [Fusarium oxysporum f. sp. albedinis]|nr:hypothetical protein HZ326_21751 [Fusarium oxysporum f. sp. albedinis]
MNEGSSNRQADCSSPRSKGSSGGDPHSPLQRKPGPSLPRPAALRKDLGEASATVEKPRSSTTSSEASSSRQRPTIELQTI